MTSSSGSNPAGLDIKLVCSTITPADRWHHFQARFGIRRNEHRVEPDLYRLGDPTGRSPVFATANYTLSFDALRSALGGIDCYILVLDTNGINVWCAAGKGTFGTDEIVCRIEATRLHEVVEHRKLIVPQLGGPGLAAHEVKKRSGFSVEFGPVRAEDLPVYLRTHKATPEMRRVRFTLRDRVVLIPVELVSVLLPTAVAAVILFFAAGLAASLGAVAAVLAAVVLFPILLPWIPTPNFSTKGFILGAIVAVPFAVAAFFSHSEFAVWQRLGWACAYLFTLPPVTAFLTLNFTGATTFTSRSGVKREMFAYIPAMAWMFGGGIVLSITFALINVLGA